VRSDTTKFSRLVFYAEGSIITNPRTSTTLIYRPISMLDGSTDSGRRENRGFYSEKRPRTHPGSPVGTQSPVIRDFFGLSVPAFFPCLQNDIACLRVVRITPARRLRLSGSPGVLRKKCYGGFTEVSGRSQNPDLVDGVLPPGRMTHRWKDLFELVPTGSRSRRSDEKWPNGRSPRFGHFHPFLPVKWLCPAQT
jgi:hypothetical protein